jgi:hypothetical protein
MQQTEGERLRVGVVVAWRIESLGEGEMLEC